MKEPSLKEKTISGVFWKFLEKFSVQGVMFIQSIIMARLLDPSDYGLIGMVAILNGVCAILVDSGFTNALIRKKDRTPEDFSTVFIFNVVMNILMAVFMVVFAPIFADFYHQPVLKNIIYLFAIQSASGCLLAVQGAKMIVDLQFRTMSFINVVTTISTGLISVALAFYGLGVYALVIPNIVMIYIRFGLYYHYQHWFPGFKFSAQSFKELFSYGSKILISNLLNCIFGNIYPIVIGKKFSSAALGYYSRGEGYAALPSATVNDVISNVTLPILSKIQDDTQELSVIYRKMLRVSAYLVFPVMIALAAMARPLVIVMISEKWIPCVIFLQILCFSAMWKPISSLNMNLLQVKGRSDLFLRITVVEKILLILVVVVTVPMGIVAMCIGSVISAYFSLFINTFYTGKLIGVGFIEQMQDLSPSFFLSLIMGGLIYYICSLFAILPLQIIAGTIIGSLFYYIISKIFRFMELEYIGNIIKENVLIKIKRIK